jgi:hypothetical protein
MILHNTVDLVSTWYIFINLLRASLRVDPEQVYRNEILTKDNLIKRNWQGRTTCRFCDHEETVQHLFIVCPFAKIIWTIVHMTFNITPPTSIDHLFGTWLNGIIKSEKANIRVGVCALIWTIWHVQN